MSSELALDELREARPVAGFRRRAQEGFPDGSRPGRLLRLSGERSGEEATSEGAHEGPPVHHSIT
jgi:hypothetical protein